MFAAVRRVLADDVLLKLQSILQVEYFLFHCDQRFVPNLRHRDLQLELNGDHEIQLVLLGATCLRCYPHAGQLAVGTIMGVHTTVRGALHGAAGQVHDVYGRSHLPDHTLPRHLLFEG